MFGVKASFDSESLLVLIDALKDMRNKMSSAIDGLESIKSFDVTAQAVMDGSLTPDTLAEYYGAEIGE